jgi:ABC-type transporter MlaC component
MMVLRILLVLVALAVGLPAGKAMAADLDSARQRVEAAVADGLGGFVGKTLPLAERSRLLDQLLRRYSDPVLLAQSVLGRYWSRSSAAEQAQFTDTFLRYLVSSYVGLMKGLDPALSVKVTGATDLGDKVRVASIANLPSQPGQPIPVDWDLVAAADGRLVVLDVSAEGVSIIRAMHDDFASVLRGSGGKIDPLLTALARKIEENDRANAE